VLTSAQPQHRSTPQSQRLSAHQRAQMLLAAVAAAVVEVLAAVAPLLVDSRPLSTPTLAHCPRGQRLVGVTDPAGCTCQRAPL